MNAHNEQHDPESAVVKQNLTTQPAAAQEAVGLIVEALKNSQPFAHIYPEAMKRHADALATAEALLSGAAPVTAAPGVDIRVFRKAVLRWKLFSELGVDVESMPMHFRKSPEKYAEDVIEATRLLALIDASPKGALNEQFGSAEGLDSPAGMEGHYRHALERIASQGPHYGPDGTRETWQHWSDIARDALADSPKGGSEAYVTLQRVDVKRLLDGDENSPGYALSRRRIADAMQAQAGDAEVQP